MVIDHPQPPPNGQVVIAEDIRPPQAEEQDHLRRPDADAFQAAQRPDGVLVTHTLHGVQIKGAAVDLSGEVRDVLRLTEGHAQGPQRRDPRREDGLGIHIAQGLPHPPPDGILRLCGDLLPDDVVDDCGEEVRVRGTVDMPHLVNDLA